MMMMMVSMESEFVVIWVVITAVKVDIPPRARRQWNRSKAWGRPCYEHIPSAKADHSYREEHPDPPQVIVPIARIRHTHADKGSSLQTLSPLVLRTLVVVMDRLGGREWMWEFIHPAETIVRCVVDDGNIECYCDIDLCHTPYNNLVTVMSLCGVCCKWMSYGSWVVVVSSERLWLWSLNNTCALLIVDGCGCTIHVCLYTWSRVGNVMGDAVKWCTQKAFWFEWLYMLGWGGCGIKSSIISNVGRDEWCGDVG